MKGLSFREFVELKKDIKLPRFTIENILENHIDIAYELNEKFKPFEFFKEYLKSGYYPFYFENEDSYLLRLQETINTVVEVDIPSIFPIEYDKIINLKKLIRLVCQSKPFKVNIKELSTKIGISDYQTLYKYLEYLKRGKIKDMQNSYIVADDMEVGSGNKIPLWLFGFLY